MNRVGDYGNYINSLKYNTNMNKGLSKFGTMITMLEEKINSNSNVTSEKLYDDAENILIKKRISSDIYATFIEPKLDMVPINRRYYLDAGPYILNGTPKIIINNIETSNNTNTATIQIYCINTNNEGGFYVLGKKYNMYTFTYKGETLELLWNSSLNVWNVLKYDSLFSNNLV